MERFVLRSRAEEETNFSKRSQKFRTGGVPGVGGRKKHLRLLEVLKHWSLPTEMSFNTYNGALSVCAGAMGCKMMMIHFVSENHAQTT